MRYQVLVDRGESPKKCTILPLADHPALDIVRFDRGQPIERLAGALLLHPDGEPLDTLAGRLNPRPGLVSAVDSSWKRLPFILKAIELPLPLLARIPDGFLTSYPRRNKLGRDPDGGLATIEALFIAGAFLGSWDETLFCQYFFAPQFFELNVPIFERYGLKRPASESSARLA